MAISNIQLKTALQKPYDRLIFGAEILTPVFGSALELIPAQKAGKELSKAESTVIESVLIYGKISFEDGSEVTLYEIKLQPDKKIEFNKVAIQRYVRKLLTSGQAALVNFIAPENNKVWRLTLISKDSELTEEGIKEKTTHAKRYTYLLGPAETCKTPADRLEALSILKEKNINSIVEAFRVDLMSEAFFDEYTLHYNRFCHYFQESSFRKSVFKISTKPGANQDEIDKASKPIRDFVKKLLGRVVFLYFVQKKGWLGASDTKYQDGLPDFIKQLFNQSGGNESFYSVWLKQLFFEALNRERKEQDFTMPDGTKLKVPFLNGGLFDKEEFDDATLTIDGKLFHNVGFEETALTEKNKDNARGFLDFLDAYNFTVHEDSPDDHTVAVDPEMLGHIFENLLEDNKDKGAFYTPKEIVHYMCQESLTEYLATQLEIKDESIKNDLSHFVRTKDVSETIKPLLKNINEKLDTVKICDPAIGSGAFPMGLLQEMHALKEVIAFELNLDWKPADVKENIIQNSIYGVDIEKGAVDIARLRFWLSLVVDVEKPRALPNLDYKIVKGDSLISKFENEIIEIDWDRKQYTSSDEKLVKKIQQLLEEIADAQRNFFDPKTKNKSEVKAQIRDKKLELLINQLTLNKLGFENRTPIVGGFAPTAKEIKQNLERELTINTYEHSLKKIKEVKKDSNANFDHFDWKLDFPEILNKNLDLNNEGFDILIANPPYDVYEGKKKSEIEEILQFEIYQKCKGGKLNAFELFLAKAHELIKPIGINCQIFQNSFLADNSSKNIREFYLKNEQIISIDSFPERDNPNTRVFKSAKMSVCILLAKKKIVDDYTFKVRVWADRFFRSGYLNQFTVSEIYSFDSKSVVIPNLKNEEKSIFRLYFSNLDKYSSAFECIEGELNMTFHKGYMTNDSSLPLIIKGAQVQRYYVTEKPSQGVIQYLDKQRYLADFSKSAKSSHHKKWRIAMQGISGANDKIRIISTLIEPEVFCANSCNYIIENIDSKNDISIMALLGIFNSSLTNWIFKKTSTNSNVNCYEVNNLRLPYHINSHQNRLLKNLVEYTLLMTRSKLNNTSYDALIPIYFQQIIDGMVYELYFPDLIKKHKREIIQHLGELPKFTDEMSDAEKMKICKEVFERLNERDHPVRVNLFYMSSIPEIAIIEGKNENN